MKPSKGSLLPLTIFSILILFFGSCQTENLTVETDSTPAQKILIEIDRERLIQEALPDSDVQDYVKMYNGETNFAARTGGIGNLITSFDPGDEPVWILAENEGITLIDFKFSVVKGENFFSGPDGEYPSLQPDGTWKAKVSTNAQPESVMKYDVYFQIEGVGTFWWDPVANIRSSDGKG